LKKIAYLVLLIGLFFSACKNKQKLSEKNSAPKSSPEWVQQRPISSAYYVGIGVASKAKSPTDFASIAKNNALNDLASEIEVKINANSVLYNLEQNSKYREDYLATTRLKSELKLENFEAVDSWQNQENYYIYYRLSKADYEATMAKRRTEASNKAVNFITNGDAAQNNQEYSLALNNYIQALLVVKDFAGDAIEIQINDKSDYLSTLLNNRISNILTDIELTIAEDVLKFNFVKREEPAGFYVTSGLGKMLKSIPLEIKQTNTFSQKVQTNSNNIGFVSVSSTDLKISKPTGNLEVKVLVEEMLSENLKKDVLVKSYLKNFKSLSQTIGYQIDYPSLFIESAEGNYGQIMGTNFFKNALSQGATEMGFPVTSNKSAAEVWVKIEADTQEGSVNFDLYTALLNGKASFYKANSESVLYTYPITKQKGVGLNYKAAGINAYEKGADKIKLEALKGFVDGLN